MPTLPETARLARLKLQGRDIDLAVRVNRRARRISLRVDPADGRVVLVLPASRARAEGLRFAETKAAWLLARLADVPPRRPFAEGEVTPLLGRPHVVRSEPSGCGVRVADGEIRVAGRPEHMARRLKDWLKAEARRDLSIRALSLAERIDERVTNVTVRESRTRWGSCTRGGRLSFCWRLVLAPEHVIDYVVAHEVAHLKHMNHGPRFWKLVGELCPEHAEARDWLRAKGAELHRYG